MGRKRGIGYRFKRYKGHRVYKVDKGNRVLEGE